jgi:hypothetical protein
MLRVGMLLHLLTDGKQPHYDWQRVSPIKCFDPKCLLLLTLLGPLLDRHCAQYLIANVLTQKAEQAEL